MLGATPLADLVIDATLEPSRRALVDLVAIGIDARGVVMGAVMMGRWGDGIGVRGSVMMMLEMEVVRERLSDMRVVEIVWLSVMIGVVRAVEW